MYFSGITEAYDYQTTEGWWVIYATYPSREFIEWMMDFPFDIWCSTVEHAEINDKQYDWDVTILIKDPAAYLHFRTRWHTEQEYMICRDDHNRHSAEYFFQDCMPNGWQMYDDIPIPKFTA
jgi:hypothetical protein